MKFSLALRQHKNLLLSLGLSVTGFAFLWIVWVIAYYCVRNELLFPSVGDTLSSVGELLFTGGELTRAFWRAFGATFLRTFLSFLVSFSCGALLAALAVSFRGVRAFLSPVVSVLRTYPTLAIVPFLIRWTSPSFAPVVVSVLVLFPAVYASALACFSDGVARYGDFAKAYRIGRAKRVFGLYLPVSLPTLLTEGGATFSMGLKIIVSGEVLASTAESLGGMMQDAQIYFAVSRLFALTIVTVLLGFVLEGACVLAKKLFIKWDRRVRK